MPDLLSSYGVVVVVVIVVQSSSSSADTLSDNTGSKDLKESIVGHVHRRGNSKADNA